MSQKMFRKISKEKLKKWLASLKARGQVLAPAKADGLWTYREFDGKDLPDQFRNSRLSPKGFFLEPLTPMFEWRSAGNSAQITPMAPPGSQRTIFGLRPCDLRALMTIKKVFASDDQDLFYLRNLSRTLLLGQACRVECAGSFCREMSIDPQDAEEADVFFREIPEGYLAKVNTERGNALAGKEFFAEASEEEWSSGRKEIGGKREKGLFDLEEAKHGVKERFGDEDFWKRISAPCVNCGICTYLCPTCHCFDLGDLQMPGRGARFRCWDSCAFPGFTKMPVHNPREEKWRRYRQRVSHKFNFFLQNYQEVACVGCGRCVANCPVNLDLREVLQEVAR